MKAGFGRVDVTPPLGSNLHGYFQLRTSNGILDPIELNALAVSVEEDTCVIITGDFLSMYAGMAADIRGKIEKETGIPANRILMQALHQHTSIAAGSATGFISEYKTVLCKKYCDVVRLALNDMAEATMSAGEKETAEPISFIRRFRMKDGSVRTNPGCLNPDIDHPLGRADNTVRLVRFHREGAKDIALVGFQTHPDVVGGNRFSADWPGFARRMVEQEKGNVHCILVNGCQGDTNHIDVSKEAIPRDPYGAKYQNSRRMGSLIADAALSLWDNTKPLAEGKISSAVSTYAFPTNTSGIERIEECKVLHQLIREGKPTPTPLNMAEKGAVRRIANLENVSLFQKVPVSMVAFGPVALVGYGGEAFTEYADVLREAFPGLFIFTCCNANGSQGYLPSAKAFEEGGYEASSSSFTPQTPVTLQAAAKEMLREHLANQ